MAKQLDAEAIAAQVMGLAEAERKSLLADILHELNEALETGPIEGDQDTWRDGFMSARLVITANF